MNSKARHLIRVRFEGQTRPTTRSVDVIMKSWRIPLMCVRVVNDSSHDSWIESKDQKDYFDCQRRLRLTQKKVEKRATGQTNRFEMQKGLRRINYSKANLTGICRQRVKERHERSRVGGKIEFRFGMQTLDERWHWIWKSMKTEGKCLGS